MLVSLIFLIGAVGAVPVSENCPNILDAAGVSKMFAQRAAHSIHSLTVEDIRYFFKEDVTEENGIPTANMDLTSDKRVLPNAPLAGYDEDFSTMGMKSFDLVMRNMNRTGWGITGSTVLERLTHAFHMSEMWDNAAKQYRMVERLLDPESDICECVTGIEKTKVVHHLHLLAFKVKYPGITSGNKTITDTFFTSREKLSEGTNQMESGSTAQAFRSGTYGDALRSGTYKEKDFDGFDFDMSDVELLKDVAEKLVDGDGEKIPHEDSAESWEIWKNLILTNIDEAWHYDLAVFMFCMLN